VKTTEQPLARADAARWLRNRLGLARAPHPQTIARWERGEGVRGRIRLRAVVLGGRSWYRVDDLEAFVRALNGEVA
jgi:hypothetical protein